MAASTSEADGLGKPVAVSFPLPKAPQTQIHLQLTNTGTSLLIFLTTTSPDPSTSAPLGSFVYAMPNVRPAAASREMPLIAR